jgi:hypothetical protein
MGVRGQRGCSEFSSCGQFSVGVYWGFFFCVSRPIPFLSTVFSCRLYLSFLHFLRLWGDNNRFTRGEDFCVLNDQHRCAHEQYLTFP